MHTTEAFLDFFHTKSGNGQWMIKSDFRYYIEAIRGNTGWFCICADCLVEKGTV